MVKSKYEVHSRFDKSIERFDSEEEAVKYFNDFIGDVLLVRNGEVVDVKKYVESFEHLIHSASWYLLKDIEEKIPWPSEGLFDVYREALPLFKNRKKGVALTGEVGVGKTIMMKVFSLIIAAGYIPEAKPFRVLSLRKISQTIMTEGVESALEKYRIGENWKSNVCLDDIGIEALKVKVYGTDVIVFPDILLELYENFTNKAAITHFTTNLLPEEIQDRYGSRVFDRIIQMAELYVFPGTSKRG